MTLSKHDNPETLIWLGVGHTPNLNQISNETKTVLVDANPSVLKSIEKQYLEQGSKLGNVSFVGVCIAPNSGEAEFFHYNLSEYSALSKVTGLLQLFPGLRLKTSETVTTTAVTDFVRSYSLSTQNNTLRIDIIDQCLPLLHALAQGGLLCLFNYLELKTSREPLYQNGATTTDVIEFLNQQGYELQTKDDNDPDLPSLGFSLNPLWQSLQEANRQLLTEKQKNEQIKAEHAKELAEKIAKVEEQTKELAKKEKKLLEVIKQNDEKKVALAEIQSRNKTLEAQNRKLQTQTRDSGVQLEQLKVELVKAEAQITLISDLFLKNNSFQVQKGK